MKITKSYLKQVIRETLEGINSEPSLEITKYQDGYIAKGGKEVNFVYIQKREDGSYLIQYKVKDIRKDPLIAKYSSDALTGGQSLVFFNSSRATISPHPELLKIVQQIITNF